MKPSVPILRSFDAALTKEFYLDFLGFDLLFEHRFDVGAPLYMSVKSGDCEIHLSEHFGDASPGAALRIEVADVAQMAKALNAKDYKYARPGWQRQEWGWDEMAVKDPSGNRLVFCSVVPPSQTENIPDSKKADR